jgi:hypothetical protein
MLKALLQKLKLSKVQKSCGAMPVQREHILDYLLDLVDKKPLNFI